ncbi:tetratricopeptide repeat protein [Pseudanabaena sp. FACHB-2040]|uniref:tetratricopeptide repeat protein n=1 Tax=Pseudanabaena sp. FACHB-2040 TaxID=2692859 RepID=UPI0016864662|nr:tetratricopeptide repeat protein [Pseudanabaena sp. FACHB-2040]MBD2257852.1 tetratricopeptide repeat protein [Pseudanabaena sp. FACHB-2040]
MENTPISDLLDALKHPDEAIRQEATDELWRLWFQQKGIYATQQLMKSQTLLETGQFEAAADLLSGIIQGQPDFAEAWNRRAVLYFTQKRYWDAIADCEQVIKLIPYHFGALHGLGLCHAALGNYGAAIQAFRKALEVQPFSLINQRLILECTAKLS